MRGRAFQPQYLRPPRNFIPITAEPIVLEIGAGKGMHAMHFAQHNMQYPLYAIERTQEKFTQFAKQAALLNLAHLHPVHADAIPWIVHAVYPQQVKQLFILYPNPEPHNPAQRWLNMPFFEYLLSRLADEATLILASNVPAYLDEAEQQLRQCWQLPFVREQLMGTTGRTHFELKYLSRGEPCQQLCVTKPARYQTHFDDVLPRVLDEQLMV